MELHIGSTWEQSYAKKNIYTRFKANRDNLLTLIKEKRGFHQEEELPESITESEEPENMDTEDTIDEKRFHNPKKIKVVIGLDAYRTMTPIHTKLKIKRSSKVTLYTCTRCTLHFATI